MSTHVNARDITLGRAMASFGGFMCTHVNVRDIKLGRAMASS